MKNIKTDYNRPWRKGQKNKNCQPGQGSRVSNRFYQTWTWRKISERFRKNNPLCVQCLKEGRTVPATVTDHIIPINPVDPYDTQDGKYPHPLDVSNFQPLCTRCHNRKRQTEKRN